MTASIPISQIVEVNPSVVGTGGNPLALNSIFLTDSANAPSATLLQFSSADDVGSYFGLSSIEYEMAMIYFNGFETATVRPGTLYFYECDLAATRGAWLHGTSLAGMTLTQLQALGTGSLTISIDGVVKSAASINLSAVASFTAAATAITSALSLSGGAAVTWDSIFSRFVVVSGTTGATSTITQATGTLSAGLGLSAGILSQGSAVDTEVGICAELKAASNDWAIFSTTFEPSTAQGLAFANWTNGEGDRYGYIAWDSDTGLKTANNATTLGAQIAALAYDGTIVVYSSYKHAAFIAGATASVDFNAINGRITFAFKSQSGLPVSVDTLADATAVLSNNTNYYGRYSAPGNGNDYNILYNGKMAGKWKWWDTYINQVFLNAQLQLAIFNGLLQVNAAPYNALGYTFIRAWCADPIDQALVNGTIRTGVALSNAQKAAINSVAGLDISNELQNNGYYLQILPATAQVRGNRQSPPVKLWYMDGGAIQQITLASIAVL